MIYDNELEKSVLGGILLNPQIYPEITDYFHEDIFYQDTHKSICKALISIKNDNNAIDLSSIINYSQKNDLNIDKIYLIGLMALRDLYGVKEKILMLNELYIRRKIIDKNTKLNELAFDRTSDVFELIGDAEKNINEILSKISVSKTFDSMDCQIELIAHLNKLSNLDHNELIGIDTGFNRLNGLTSGWQNSDLIILAGRPAMGKTSFLLNCVHSAIKKYPTLVFSLEMSKLQLYARMCSQITNIPLEKFLKIKMDDEDRKLFNDSTYNLYNSELYIDDRGGVDITYIKTKARKLVREKKIKFIVIDYLQLIHTKNSKGNTNDDISKITIALKNLAKELNIPIICLSQLSREVEKRADKRPQLSDLRDSGAIEQDADMVIFIYRPEYYGIMDDGMGNSTIGKAQIIVSKHRNGATDDLIVNFDGRCTNFYDSRY